MSSNENECSEQVLTKAQVDRIEKNKLKAQTLRKAKLIAHPYFKDDVVTIEKSAIKIGGIKYKDTGGGFLLEEDPEEPEKEETPTIEKPPIFEPDRPTCETCMKVFAKSWLFDNFDHKVCDDCKDDEIHTLITKTEAQKEYLLKDVDLEKREPPLRYLSRKNPHNVRWGEMKLYLQVQVEKRALEIWGSEEALREELEKREEKKVIAKGKKYQKQMKELRMSMRSSLYDRTSSASHVHEFGPETYNEEGDTYTHVCGSCNYKEIFEKM